MLYQVRTFYIAHRLAIILTALIIPTGFSLLDLAQQNPDMSSADIQANWEQSIFFNSTFLANYSLVNQLLQEKEGFQEIYFTSTDGFKLSGLYKEVPDATATIIFCAGFFPGRKEGIATFVTMAPKNYNLLFFDARGHGSSEGPLWATLMQYGLNEYKDILGAIDWIHKKTNRPIIIHGLCAGAFNTVKAVHSLIQEKTFEHYQIQGLILDSCISSIPASVIIPVLHIKDKFLPALLQKIYTDDTKVSVKDRWLYKISWCALSPLLYAFHWYAKRQFSRQGDELTIESRISAIPCPILFIHANKDVYSSYQSTCNLSVLAQKPSQFTVEDTDHAILHLKHKYEYRIALTTFIHQITNHQAASATAFC